MTKPRKTKYEAVCKNITLVETYNVNLVWNEGEVGDTSYPIIF
jgi:hypothetical protein